MEPDRNATEQISLFPDHVKPVFLHLRHPPHLLDEKIRAFDCSAKKKAAEAACGIPICSFWWSAVLFLLSFLTAGYGIFLAA